MPLGQDVSRNEAFVWIENLTSSLNQFLAFYCLENQKRKHNNENNSFLNQIKEKRQSELLLAAGIGIT